MILTEQQREILAKYQKLVTPEQFAQNQSIRVVAGMSGGVDSSVVAAILKSQGYDVVGIFMKNWEETDENGFCSAEADYQDVASVCQRLNIPYYSLNFAQEYRERVFQRFLHEYEQGLTPNPDILCNLEIKFNVFYQAARKLGARYLATGHYTQNIQNELHKGLDPSKDQSYFLYTIKAHILENVLFPIGDMLKSDVRKLAEAFDLTTSKKKDSTGICFIGERDFREFLSQYIKSTKGDFVDLNGNVLGAHHGHPFYTIGQRKGLGLGGPGGPWFVVGKNIEANQVIVAEGENHPALFSDGLFATEIELVSERPLQFPLRCTAKVRYRQADVACTVTEERDGRLKVVFDSPQRAITERQSVVFYQDSLCLGGAIIDEVMENYFVKNGSQDLRCAPLSSHPV
jgi:tRNA-uridine 2-sulfurtransferase